MVEEIITALSRFKWLFVIAELYVHGQGRRCQRGRTQARRALRP
jgi:TolB-like protein